MSTEQASVDNITSASQALSDMRAAAASCEGTALVRLALNTSTACDGIASAVADTVACVSNTMKRARARAKMLCGRREKLLEWRFEELTALKSVVEGWERQLRAESDDTVDLDAIEASLCTAGQLLSDLDPLPTLSSVVAAGHERDSARASPVTHVQLGVDSACSGVAHAQWLRHGEGNVVCVSCRDGAGHPVRTISAEDVCVGLSECDAGWCVTGVSAEGGTVAVRVALSSSAAPKVVLCITIGCTRLEVPLQAGSSIFGTHIRNVVTSTSVGNSGLAISPDGTRMAISKSDTNRISVYSLPDGAHQAEFVGGGTGPSHFSYPRKICFAPRNGNLLIADGHNKRVQEMTLSGAHVKTIGVTTGDVTGIAASSDMIAVSAQSVSNRVWMFDMASGRLLRSFGEEGSGGGQLYGNEGIRFTPDGRHILIAEGGNNRLSLFTLSGDFVRCIGEGTLDHPSDVDFTASGDILVADYGKDCMCVFSADGSTLLRSFGSWGDAPGQFKYPTALAMHGEQPYVLDYDSARVQVFT